MKKETLLTGGSIIGALLASGCCVIPFVLFSLGVGGAWMSNLRVLEPYSLYFIIFSLALALTGLYVMKRKKINQECSTDGYCETVVADRVRSIVLWGSIFLIGLALAWPKLLPLFLGSTQ